MKKTFLIYSLLFSSFMMVQAQSLEDQLKDFANSQHPSALSIAIIKDGHITYHHFGRLSRKNKQQPDEHTLYEIGALSGVFTSTLMLRLSEKGIFNPEQEIADYLPDHLTPPIFQPQRCTEVILSGTPIRRIMSCSNDMSRASVCITGCDLASHVSGLPNSGLGIYDWHPIGKAAYLTGPKPGFDETQLVQTLNESDFKAEPGRNYHYS
ncbi:MAG: serine hydrolase, partial [Mameliella sp.]|nr:serine hydrolase [Phaeodactylibacter sp.]